MPSILDRVFGSILLGTFFSSVLCGIITVQASLYFSKFKRDPLATRLVVGLLWLMQGFQVAVSSRGVYYYIITSQLNPFNLIYQTWELSYYGTHTVLTSVIVQIFFTYRLWKISKNIVAAVSIGLLIATQFAFGMIVAIRSYIYTLTTDTHAHETWDVDSWLAFSAGADTAIALALVILLRRQRTGFATTDSVLNAIILYGVQTGMVTSIVAIILLMCYAIGGYFETLLLIGIPLGGVYITTMLATLHSRTNLRARMEEGKPKPVQKTPTPNHSLSLPRSGGTITSPTSAWPFIHSSNASSRNATASDGSGRHTIDSKGTITSLGTGSSSTAVDTVTKGSVRSDDTVLIIERQYQEFHLDERDDANQWRVDWEPQPPLPLVAETEEDSWSTRGWRWGRNGHGPGPEPMELNRL